MLSKILDSFRPSLLEFYGKYFKFNNDGEIVHVKDLVLPNKFIHLAAEIPKNAMRIHNQFGNIYLNYKKLIRDTENNQIIV